MYVIAYDISDDRRRTRLFKTLKQFGTPVQESVFECHLNANQFNQMRLAVEQLIEPREDQVRPRDQEDCGPRKVWTRRKPSQATREPI